MKQLFKNNLISRRQMPNANSFILIEVMIAIVLLGMGLAAGLYFLNKSLVTFSYNRDYLIATELAKEGIELVRYIRDTNWLKGESFNTGFDNTGFDQEDISYCVDAFNTTQKIRECSVADQMKIARLGSYANFYSVPWGRQEDWEDTQFSRYLKISYPSYSDQRGNEIEQNPKILARVESVVKFRGLGREQEVKIIDYLYDWYK